MSLFQPEVQDNKIPEAERPARPTVNEYEIIQKSNEIPILGNEVSHGDDHPSNVLMSHAGNESIFDKTEVLAGEP